MATEAAAAAPPPPTEAHLPAEQLFDDVGAAYEDAFAGLATQAAAISWLVDSLAAAGVKPAKIVDLGCGTGKPTVSTLADAGHDVLGIDISGAMIAAAKARVPNAAFEQADMRGYFAATPKESLDAATVFFSMIASVTQAEIKEFMASIYGLLKPGGFFVFATVPIAADSIQIKWMGRPVQVSSLSAEEGVEAVKAAGFEVVEHAVSAFTPKAEAAGICSQDEVWEEPHLFVYAKKPAA